MYCYTGLCLLLALSLSTEGFPFVQSSSGQNKIVGGEDANIEDYPYHVVILYDGRTYCGGSIISERFVVSAAHCFIGDYPPSMYAVRVGSNYSNAYGEIVPVSSYTIHPKYSQVYNDICVAELSKPLEFSKAVQPIALPEEGNELPEGTLTVVTGFGETEPKEYRGRRLQAVRVPIVSPEKCKAAYPIVDETMLCAGYEEGGKDACQGDSGGPLAYNGKLYGVVSFGMGCARPEYPGVYANVPNLLEFVKNVIGG